MGLEEGSVAVDIGREKAGKAREKRVRVGSDRGSESSKGKEGVSLVVNELSTITFVFLSRLGTRRRGSSVEQACLRIKVGMIVEAGKAVEGDQSSS